MDDIRETINKRSEEAAKRFAANFEHGRFIKYRSVNNGPKYSHINPENEMSLFDADEEDFQTFLSSKLAKHLMKTE